MTKPELIRLDSGLFPNIKSEPGDLLAHLDNGARAICRVQADGVVAMVRYLHGPDATHEADRLGLIDARTVRVRDIPDDHWAKGPAPDEIEEALKEVPAALRGRLGTLMGIGKTNKHAQFVEVKLHRATPGEVRATLTVPMIWLERVE